MKRIGLYLFIIGITFIKAYGQEDSGPVNTGAANYLTIPVDARKPRPWEVPVWRFRG
ncbi:hypothetical protein NXW05_04835 [Phocaeicola vulgatus]|nr:hypothetical protein [Phocaeicola vulgatus]